MDIEAGGAGGCVGQGTGGGWSWEYRVGHAGARFVLFCTMRVRTIRPEMARREGAFILATSHLSHLDPFLLGALNVRPVDWVTRVEFFKYRLFARILRKAHAFEVRRAGVPVSTIRTAIARLQAGRIVGICPEGGVMRGKESCVRGGDIKRRGGLDFVSVGARCCLA